MPKLDKNDPLGLYSSDHFAVSRELEKEGADNEDQAQHSES